jgi:hypothetical protein
MCAGPALAKKVQDLPSSAAFGKIGAQYVEAIHCFAQRGFSRQQFVSTLSVKAISWADHRVTLDRGAQSGLEGPLFREQNARKRFFRNAR